MSKDGCNNCDKSDSTPLAFLLTCCRCKRKYHHRCHFPYVSDKELVARIHATNGNDTLENWMCRRCLKSKAKAEARGQVQVANVSIPPLGQLHEKQQSLRKRDDVSSGLARSKDAPVARSNAGSLLSAAAEHGAKDSRLKPASKNPLGGGSSTTGAASGSQRTRAPARAHPQNPVPASKVIGVSSPPSHYMSPEQNHKTSRALAVASSTADLRSSRPRWEPQSKVAHPNPTLHPPHPALPSSSEPIRLTLPETADNSVQPPPLDITTISPPSEFSTNDEDSRPGTSNTPTGTGPSPPRLKKGFRKTVVPNSVAKLPSSAEKVSVMMTPDAVRSQQAGLADSLRTVQSSVDVDLVSETPSENPVVLRHRVEEPMDIDNVILLDRTPPDYHTSRISAVPSSSFPQKFTKHVPMVIDIDEDMDGSYRPPRNTLQELIRRSIPFSMSTSIPPPHPIPHIKEPQLDVLQMLQERHSDTWNKEVIKATRRARKFQAKSRGEIAQISSGRMGNMGRLDERAKWKPGLVDIL